MPNSIYKFVKQKQFIGSETFWSMSLEKREILNSQNLLLSPEKSGRLRK